MKLLTTHRNGKMAYLRNDRSRKLTTEIDYEEGTFTPAFNRGSGDNPMPEGTDPNECEYNQRLGTYTKIGNLVTAQVYIKIDVDHVTDGLMGATLPFVAVGTYSASASIGFSAGWLATDAPSHGFATPSTSHIDFVRSASNYGVAINENISSNVGGNAIASNSEVKFSITYIVS